MTNTRRVLFCCVLLLGSDAVFADDVSLARFGWTVIADPAAAQLSVRHEKLGVVLDKVEFKVAVNGEFVRLQKWQAENQGDNRMVIKTLDPATAWHVDLSETEVRISSTSDKAVLAGRAPAPSERMIARLLDPEGTPVVWSGTAEVAHSYGGGYTRHPSFLPRRNPECMYFALGEVPAAGFHSLFDRRTDIAIDFAEGASLTRDPGNIDMLTVSIPVPGSTFLRLLPGYFTNPLGAPFYVPYNDASYPTAPMVWSSWTSYYEDVREDDMTRNAD